MFKVKELSKKKKLVIVGALILAVGVVGGSVYASNQSQQKLNEAQAVVDKEYSTLQGLEKEIQALFDEKDINFLAEGVTADQIDTLKDKVAAVNKNYSSIDVDVKQLDTKAFSKEKSSVGDQLAAASDKLEVQEAVNGLFSEKDKIALKGSTVTKDLAIVDNLDGKVVDSVKDLIGEELESTFDQTVSNLTVAAEGQLRQIETATTSVQKVYKGDKVVSTETKLYDAAKKEVDKIKNAKAKKALSDQLAKVKAAIDKKAKDAKAAEEKAKAEAETQAVAGAQAEQATEQAAATDQYVAGVDQSTGAAPAADTTANNYYDYSASQAASGSGTEQTTPVYQAPETPAAPSTPSTGNGSGIADQDQMNQWEQDASQGGASNWDDVFGK